jgi:hypothetical protein
VKEQKECRGKPFLAIRFLFTDGSLLPSHNPLENKANQKIKSLRVSKRANKILCRHGGSSIEIIPVIYFPEGIIADSWMELKKATPAEKVLETHSQPGRTHGMAPDRLQHQILTAAMNGRHGGVSIFAVGLWPRVFSLRIEDTLKSIGWK